MLRIKINLLNLAMFYKQNLIAQNVYDKTAVDNLDKVDIKKNKIMSLTYLLVEGRP